MTRRYRFSGTVVVTQDEDLSADTEAACVRQALRAFQKRIGSELAAFIRKNMSDAAEIVVMVDTPTVDRVDEVEVELRGRDGEALEVL